MIENPVLEENLDDKRPTASTKPRRSTVSRPPRSKEEAPAEVEQASNIDQIDWKEFAENYSNDSHGATGAGSSNDDDDDRRPAIENIMVKRDAAAGPSDVAAPLVGHERGRQGDRRPARGALDQDGYLSLSTDEVAFSRERLAGHGASTACSRACSALIRRASPRAICPSAC
jgi:hypothetical protein